MDHAVASRVDANGFLSQVDGPMDWALMEKLLKKHFQKTAAADGLGCRAQGTGGRVDAVALGVQDHYPAQEKFMVHGADHVVVWARAKVRSPP